MSELVSLVDRLADSRALETAASKAGITSAQAKAFCAALADLNVNQLARIVVVSFDDHVRQQNRMTRRGQ